MRFLIVDDSREQREALAGTLRTRWPAADMQAWEPRRQGHPGKALAAGGYAAVLLDPGDNAEDGIAWVAEIRQDPAAPPVVLIAQAGGEHLAVKAMKAGAADFLSRGALSEARLLHSVQEALRERHEANKDGTGTTPFFLRTVQMDPRRIGRTAGTQDTAVPGYRILRLIGEGGMGQVYLAEREHDGVQLVLKMLDASLRTDDTYRRRFVQEYKIIADLQSEYVARVYDQGFASEHPYIAMEYFPGGTLADRIREGLGSLESLRITARIARALDAIHAKGIVHRDLKPQNIMFRADGRPAIVDFGLARRMDVDSTLTQHGEVLATPRYMSPEQCLGKVADARSDLYSLGVIFYEMLTGQKLYADENHAGLVYMHVHGELPVLPPKLAGYQPILARLLAKDPAQRFQSARDLFATIAV